MKSKEATETSKPTAKIESTGTHTRKCMVYLLNGQEFQCSVERNANGSRLLGQIRELLDIIEFDYFGLYFEDSAQHRYWLEAGKSIKKQLKNSPWKFHLSVKFYPSDPSQLAEDMSRYYMMLQLRDNIVSGRLPCSFVTHALLGSFVVQSELGDHDITSMKGNYVAGFEFAPNQSAALEDKVIELHKTHKGLTPEEAEVAFLENVKKLPLYGVDQHMVKDSENVDLMLGVCWNGLKVHRDGVQINRFAWPRILKISYTRNKFYIRIRPVDDQVAESVVGFKLPNHRAAKKLWKSCVEHHTFFRLTKPGAPKNKLIRTGSRFRYTGQTQHQTRHTVATSTRKNVPKIQRTASRRSYSTSEKQTAKASSSENQSPPELPRKEHTTTTKIVTVTEEIVMKEIKVPQKTEAEVTEEVTITEETVQNQHEKEGHTEKGQPKSLTSSSSSLSNISDEDTLTKHQRTVQKMKPKKRGEKTDADGKFLQEQPPGSTGSSEWDLRLQSSPAKSVDENETENADDRSTEQPTRQVTVVTTVTTEVEGVVTTKRDDARESSSSSSSEDGEVQEVNAQDARPPPLPDFVPAVEPTSSPKSSSSNEENAEEDVEQKEPTEEDKEDEEVRESKIVHTEYHVTETVIHQTQPENEIEEGQPIKLEESEEISKEEPQLQAESSSSSSSSTESEVEEEEKKTEEAPPKQEDAPPEDNEVNENNNNNEDVSQPKTDFIKNSENITVSQNVITTVETKSVRVEDVVIPREDNEVRKVALTADLDNNVTVTETRSTSSSSSSSSSESESEDATNDPAVNGFKKPPIVETEVVYVEPTEEEKPAVTTEPPLVHTETKTITYESSQHRPDLIDSSNDIQLLSSQTITAETMSSVTTTHITKTVVGSVSETRVEKSIVITADGDANLHQAMAEAIKDTQENNPDVSITKVVVQEEKVMENP